MYITEKVNCIDCGVRFVMVVEKGMTFTCADCEAKALRQQEWIAYGRDCVYTP